MEAIIPISEGQFQVDARDLHEFLEIGKDYTTWIKDRIQQFGFREGADYQVFPEFGGNPTGGRPAMVYQMTLGMAKELSMVQNNERGKQARLYFIACEERLKQIVQAPRLPASYAEALRELADTVEQKALLEAKIEEDKPAVDFYAKVGDAKGLHTMNEAAKLLGWGEIKLFAHLRDMRILCEQPHNVPRQCYIDQGYFLSKETTYTKDGAQYVHSTTYVTPKGLEWLHKVAPVPQKRHGAAHPGMALKEIRHTFGSETAESFAGR